MNDDDGCSNKFGAAIPKDSTENLLVLRMILILRKGWSTSVYDMLMNKEKTIVPKESLLWVLQHSDEPDDTKLWKLAILLCGIAEVPNATSKSGAAGGAGGSTGWSSSRMTCTDGAGDSDHSEIAKLQKEHKKVLARALSQTNETLEKLVKENKQQAEKIEQQNNKLAKLHTMFRSQDEKLDKLLIMFRSQV